MRQRRPPFIPGHYYHIYNRGVSKEPIFREETNYLFTIRKIKKYTKEINLTMIAYCLMPNHYHFLIRQEGQQPAGLLPQRLFNSYTKAYNKRYRHSGTLFEGPYEAIRIAKLNHLLHLCRYIHANPVKDGIVSELDKWPFSNYLEWVGSRRGALVDHEFVCQHFQEPKLYREFVLDYLKSREMPLELEKYLKNL